MPHANRWGDDPKGPLFLARFDGRCADCKASFYEGDDVGYVENDLVCIDCWEAA